jgi:hypothetical protein
MIHAITTIHLTSFENAYPPIKNCARLVSRLKAFRAGIV